MANLEFLAEEHAKGVVYANPEAKAAEDLIQTSVIYGYHIGANGDGLSEDLTFGQAIEKLKRGCKVARKDWSVGSFLWLKPAGIIKAEWCKDPILRTVVEKLGGEVPALGTICMFTEHGEVLSGWLASQTDILSNDWIIVSVSNY